MLGFLACPYSWICCLALAAASAAEAAIGLLCVTCIACLYCLPVLSASACTAGTVKIVVSTNVAETSITIDDVTTVIDTGRVKEMRFDASRGIARLQETFVSQVGAVLL